MKYTSEVIVNQPRDRVVDLFLHPDYLSEWQPELIERTPLGGKPGEEGATASLRYRMGRRETKMVETLLEQDLPRSSVSTYDAPGVHNWVYHRFETLSDQQTRIVSENIFSFRGWTAWVFPLMKRAFKKQTDKSLHQFKTYAEAQHQAEPQRV